MHSFAGGPIEDLVRSQMSQQQNHPEIHSSKNVCLFRPSVTNGMLSQLSNATSRFFTTDCSDLVID